MRRTTVFLFLAVAVLACGNARSAWALGMEKFGNEDLGEANYRAWPGIAPLVNHTSRVYQNWVNGNEHFFYRGDTTVLNDALGKFAASEAKVHEVLLRPAPCIVKSFDGSKTVPYNWDLHIVGGIAQHQTKLDQGSKIWSKYPMMTVAVGGDVRLEKIEIPQGVTVVDLADLSARYREALASTDISVRGWGAGKLARLDPHSAENLAAVIRVLKDDDSWVRSNAVGALAAFGKRAESVLPTLRAMLNTEEDKNLRNRIEKTTAQIEQAKDDPAAEHEFQLIQKSIRAFHDARAH